MRKSLVIVATAVVALIAAASAFAAINTYTAKVKVSPTKAGTKAKPVAIGYTEDITASGTDGNRTALLEDIKTTVSGAKLTLKGVPTCSLSSIAAAKNDTGCPKGALLATGYIHAVVGSATDFKANAAPCNPGLDVWNSGGGKLTFFFVDTAAHNCDALGLKTGSTGPYPATYKQQGGKVVVDTPIPSFVNRPARSGGLPRGRAPGLEERQDQGQRQERRRAAVHGLHRRQAPLRGLAQGDPADDEYHGDQGRLRHVCLHQVVRRSN